MTCRPLFSYQTPVFEWAAPKPKIALFLKMRLGKTVVTIRWLEARGCKRVLIVCPLSVIEVWETELATDGHCFTTHRPGMPRRLSRFNITNYHQLLSNPWLLEQKWDCVVLDESLAIANPKANITRLVLESFASVPNKAILTGEPAPESQLQYFTQLKFLFGRVLGHTNYYEFRDSFFCSFDGWDWFPNAEFHKTFPFFLAENTYRLTRKQAGLKNTTVQEEERMIDMPETLRPVYAEARDFFILKDLRTKYAVTAGSWLHRLSGGSHPAIMWEEKRDAMFNLLHNELRDEQVVLWFKFRNEIRHALNRFKRKDRVGVIHGNVSLDNRKREIRRFRQKKTNWLLCQTESMQYGTDLSAADVAIFYSLPWSSRVYEQARERVFHPEKRDLCQAMLLLTRDSIDEKIRLCLINKRGESNAMAFAVRELLK